MKSVISVLAILINFIGFSQEIITEHIVSPNETLAKIANKYKVRQSDILELNPNAQNGLQQTSVLFIPVEPNSKTTTANTAYLHKVLQKETIYSISRDYQVDVKDIYATNAGLVADLKIGQKIIIYKIQATPNTNQSLEYEVLAKETKYSIARANNLSIADLENANPTLKNQDLKVGQKIIIPNKGSIKQTNQTIDSKIQNNNSSLVYEVLAKETKYGIARKFNTSVAELEKLNPEINTGLHIGQKIFLPNTTVANSSTQNQAVAQTSTSIIEKNTKEKPNNDLIEQVILAAFQNIGTRYRPGGTTRDEGFDCSGLMFNAFSAFNIDLPRSSHEQSQSGVVVNVEEAKKGDLIFFKTGGGSQINHVGMVVEVSDGDVKFIHAASTGVIVSSIKENYYSKRLVQLNRVL